MRYTFINALAVLIFLSNGCGTQSSPHEGSGAAGEGAGAAGRHAEPDGGKAGFSGDASAGSSPGTGGSLDRGGAPTAGRAGAEASAGEPSSVGGGAEVGGAGSASPVSGATVVIFAIDGVQTAAINTATANGATNIKYLIDNGVTVQTSYSTSPAVRITVPNKPLPWDNATSGNVAMHTGCHLFDSNQMDDIFIAAHAAGIKSVYSGGDPNYYVFTTSDFEYSGKLGDDEVVQHGIDHLKQDGVRLIRLHLQRIRDFWTGPASETTASSTYVKHLLEVDALLGKLRQALEDSGVWSKTYVILTSDHGMGQSSSTDHPQSTLSSWKNIMYFYGPGVKRGASIPYAELPDVAVMTNHLLGLPPLRGHTDPTVTLPQKGATGTLLSNIFEGAPNTVVHPQLVQHYLDTGTYMTGGDDFADYRSGMLKLIK